MDAGVIALILVLGIIGVIVIFYILAAIMEMFPYDHR